MATNHLLSLTQPTTMPEHTFTLPVHTDAASARECCTLCRHPYQPNHKPLLPIQLPCSHIFCFSCLENCFTRQLHIQPFHCSCLLCFCIVYETRPHPTWIAHLRASAPNDAHMRVDITYDDDDVSLAVQPPSEQQLAEHLRAVEDGLADMAIAARSDDPFDEQLWAAEAGLAGMGTGLSAAAPREHPQSYGEMLQVAQEVCERLRELGVGDAPSREEVCDILFDYAFEIAMHGQAITSLPRWMAAIGFNLV